MLRSMGAYSAHMMRCWSGAETMRCHVWGRAKRRARDDKFELSRDQLSIEVPRRVAEDRHDDG